MEHHPAGNRTYEEVKIPVPWGYIAGKWWGPQDRRPILALHGWQDNCGSFDRLIPYLPPHLGVLAVDTPGHGLTSRLPPGIMYHNIEIILLILRVREYFKWPKVSILAHSLGAMYGYAFTMLYPESVDFIICLDGLYPFETQENESLDGMAKAFNAFLKYDHLISKAGSEPPSYTFEELEELLHKASVGAINKDVCKFILKRNITESKINPGKYFIWRDPRCKVSSVLNWSPEAIMEGSKRVCCPVFLSIGNKSLYLHIVKFALEVLDIIRQHNNNVEYHEVEGTHHVHLNNPENVVHLVNAFIKKYDKEDRSVGGLIKNYSKL